MTLNKELVRRLNCYLKDIEESFFSHLGSVEFSGFVTDERLSLSEALKREKQPFTQGTKWGCKWEYGWFFTNVKIPECAADQRVVFRAELGEGVVFVNGKIVGALDKKHTEITLSKNAVAGEEFEIAMEVYATHGVPLKALETAFATQYTDTPDNIPLKSIKDGEFGVWNEELFGLYFDLSTIYDLRKSIDDKSLRAAKIDGALLKFCSVINFELEFDEFIKTVVEARKVLKPLLECKNGSTSPTMYAIGHSHLDLEWLWTIEETRRKSARTMGNQLTLLNEYPNYKYIQSQPWILNTIKNEYPDLYADVQQAVKEDRIVIEGGMWVEADTNLPSGESLIRQFLYGKKFIKDEFNIDSKMLWLPDIFGVSGALPQIMKKCGIEYFMNAKVTWAYNGGEPAERKTFMWEGIDGSQILTHLTQNYEHNTLPSDIIETWELTADKSCVDAHLYQFGYGDGGGGPTRHHMEYLNRQTDLECVPKVKIESPVKLFEYLNQCEITERFRGELYYAAHRGTYTSQAKTKQLNRKAEFALKDTEFWGAVFDSYPKTSIDELWKKVLFNQFHDVIPGSSIAEVHKRAELSYTEVINQANTITDFALNNILIDNRDAVCIFNSLSWERNQLIPIPEGFEGIADENGNIMPSQDGYALVSVLPCGWNTYNLIKSAPTNKSEIGIGLFLENEYIKAEFNENGELISFYDKETKTEMLSGISNKFRLYRDSSYPFDAWDIDSVYECFETEIPEKAEIKTVRCGNLFSQMTFTRKINNSILTQTVTLSENSRQLDFKTEVDWNELHMLLKVDFDTVINSDELLSETQFGYVKRPTHKNKQYDKDRFEVCQHKWSALCESGVGAAILNDSKYGISANGGKMSLTLLRSSAAPEYRADNGKQIFTYSFVTFNSSFNQSNIVNKAYELNLPVIVKKGSLGSRCLFETDADNIIIDTVKKAEDGNGIVLRIYESCNTHTLCNLKFNIPVNKIYVTNMLEENPEEIEFKDNCTELSFSGFEVKTIQIK